MIKNLRYSAVFPTSDTTIRGDHILQPGITTVVGPNGSGKSFGLLEVPRWLLYGKAALRGAASDYKKVEASGTFTINGSDYLIERSAKRERISDSEGAELAVGSEAVTAKVTELMNYGLDVFDIANASLQKKTDALGRMRPGERKKLIDKVLGLSSNEKLEKECRSEATIYKGQAEGFAQLLRKPEKPLKPKGYRNSDILVAELNDLRALKQEHDHLSAEILPVGPEPEAPVAPDTTYNLEFVDQHERIRLLQLEEKTRLERLASREDPRHTSEQLDVAEKRNAYEDLPKLAYDLNMEDIAKLLEAWAEYQALSKLADTGLECPSCRTNFVLPSEPPCGISSHNLRIEADRISEREAFGEKPEGLDLSPTEIEDCRAKLADHSEVIEARAALVGFPILEDWSELRSSLALFLRDNERYQYVKTQRKTSLNNNDWVEKKIAELAPSPSWAKLDDLQDQIGEARRYELGVEQYDKDKRAFADLSKKIETAQTLALEFRKGADALAKARGVVKANLAPLLSTIASGLLHEMTNGKFSSVVIDDEMDILVGRQGIETLSGGQQTVANLALRLALGQVLAGKTFPVFLGDEMDSDADDEHREAVAEAFSSLKSRFSQLILVTHRGQDLADQVITV